MRKKNTENTADKDTLENNVRRKRCMSRIVTKQFFKRNRGKKKTMKINQIRSYNGISVKKNCIFCMLEKEEKKN